MAFSPFKIEGEKILSNYMDLEKICILWFSQYSKKLKLPNCNKKNIAHDLPLLQYTNVVFPNFLKFSTIRISKYLKSFLSSLFSNVSQSFLNKLFIINTFTTSKIHGNNIVNIIS